MSETRTLKVVVVGNAKQASAALKQLAGDADNVGSSVSKSGLKFGAVMSKMGKSAALGFGVAAAAAGAFVYKVGAPYEQTLNRIGALNKLNEEQTTKVAKRIESGSAAYARMGVTVGEAAQGVMELNKAGLSLNQSIKSVNATMVLAKAGNMSVDESANLVANTLNTFKLSAKDAGTVVNSLANAANASSADVSDLQQALAMSGLAANQAGLSIESTSAYLAMLHNNGMKGSDAGTSLKTALLRLTSGAGPVNKALKEIGVSVFDADGKMRNMNDVIRDFLPKLDDMSDEKRAKALYKIFGSDSIRAATAIFGEGSAGILKMQKSVREAGTAQRFAESATKGLSGTVLKLKANFMSLGQVTYRALSPLANKLLTPVANGMAKLVPLVEPLAKKLGSLFSGGGGGSAKFAETFGTIKTFASELLPVFKEFGDKLMNKLGPAFSQIGAIIKNDLLPAFNAFLPAVTPIAKFILKVLGEAVLGVIGGVINVIKGLLKVISGIFNVIAGVLTGDWGRAWDGVKQIVSGAVQAIWGVIQVWWNGSILALFRRIPLALKGLWTKAWEGLKAGAKAGINGLKTIVSKVLEFLTAPFRKGFNAVKDYVVNGFNFIRGKFSGGVGGIKAVLSRLIEVITYPYRQAFNLAKSVITNGWNMAKNAFSNGIATVMGIVRGLPGKIKGVFSSAGTWLYQAGKDVISGIVRGLDSAKQWILDKIAELTNMIPGKFKKLLGIASPSKVMKALAKWVVKGITEGLSDSSSLQQLQKRLDNIGGRIKNLFKKGKIGDGFKDNMLDMLKDNRKKVLKVVKERLRLQDALDKAQAELDSRMEKLTSLRDAKASLAESVTSAAKDHGGLLSVLDPEAGNSVGQLLSRFAKRLQNIRNFKSNLEALVARGLSNSLIRQIAAGGPDEGGAMAAALMRAVPGQLAQFNGIDAAIDAESAGLGALAGSTYDAEINAAQASYDAQAPIVQHIKVEVKGNVTAEQDLAKAIAKTVREEIERIDNRNGKKKK